MPASLSGRAVVVTGASRGIGRAIALECAAAGADVAVCARSTDAAPLRAPGTVDSVAREVEAMGGRALAVQVDITDEGQVLEAARRVIASLGRVDVLVNNAAYLYRAPVLDTPAAKWDLVLDVNLRGAVLCAQAFLPRMVERREGRIINISSSAGQMALRGIASYSASKAALEAFTVTLAAEVEASGIAVNALRVDRAVATEGALLVSRDSDRSGWAKPEEVAAAFLWLAAQDAGYTGRVVTMSEALAGVGRAG